MIALLLAMLCQFAPGSANDLIRQDMVFERAVEESVLAAAPDALPEPYKGLMARLGDSAWKRRDEASKALQAAVVADPGAQRWLWWIRASRDPECRLRANWILRRLHPCETCAGSGNGNWSPDYPCWECGGTSTQWPYTPFD